jgi:uncharacterized protein
VQITLAILAVLITLLASGAGVLLTVLTLPGVWLTLLIAAGLQLAYPEPPFSWYTLGVCTGLALIGEIYELVAAPAAARRKGGGRSGAWGSVIGSIIGAIAGSVVLPVIGTIIGAVVGAGVGALALERGIGQKTWSHATSIGAAAAKGRFVGTVVKTALAAAVGLALTVASIVP